MEKINNLILVFQKILSMMSIIVISGIINRNYGNDILASFAIISSYSSLVVELVSISCGIYIFQKYINRSVDKSLVIIHIIQMFLLALIFILIGAFFSSINFMLASLMALSLALNIYIIWLARATTGLASIYLSCTSFFLPISNILILIINYYAQEFILDRYIVLISFVNVFVCTSILIIVFSLKINKNIYKIYKIELEEINFRIDSSIGSIAVAALFLIPILIYSQVVDDPSGYTIFALRIKASFLIFTYMLELSEAYLFKKYVTHQKMNNFFKAYKALGLIYLLSMLFISYVFYCYGDYITTLIFGKNAENLFHYLLIYLLAFSLFGLLNNGMTLINLLGKPKVSLKILCIAIFPYAITLWIIAINFTDYYIECDIVLFLIIFFIMSISAYRQLKIYLKDQYVIRS